MLILFKKTLRKIIREEFERFMGAPESPPNNYSIKSASGGEIIMPNIIKERFDEGKVTSLKDII